MLRKYDREFKLEAIRWLRKRAVPQSRWSSAWESARASSVGGKSSCGIGGKKRSPAPAIEVTGTKRSGVCASSWGV